MTSTEKLVYTKEEVELLERWGKSAKNYFLLHDKAYNEYVKRNYSLTIPVIILSTLSGTASFSIQSFPESIRSYVPMMIGGINIFVGILQTMTQFMKVNEMVSEHRISAINFDKFSRNITAELSLPENERSYSGKDFVHFCRKEMDRIIEQSPVVPEHILCNLEKIIKSDTITNNQNKIVGFIEDTKFGIDEIHNGTKIVNDISDSDYIKINMQQLKDSVVKKTIEKAKTLIASTERGPNVDSALVNKSSAEVIPSESHKQNVSVSIQEEIGIIEPIEDNV
jgi:hypothetical protein